jgi:chromate transporter
VRSGKVAALVALLALPMLGLLFLVSRKLCALGCVMLKVDLLAFGGGFAAVPLMLHEVVDLRHWMNGSTFMDGIALGQATPGPIVITATFAGYQIAGLAGACVATLCIFTPSFLLVLGTVPYLDRLRQSALLQKMLRGILASFAGLLFAVAMRFGWAVEWSLPTAFTGVGALVALRLKLDILWVVLAGAAMAALFM